MIIALPFENNNIFSPFEHAMSFKIYEIENGKIVTMRFIPSTDVQNLKIHAILCSCIGDDIKAALTGKNISVHTGYSGNADMAVKTFLGR